MWFLTGGATDANVTIDDCDDDDVPALAVRATLGDLEETATVFDLRFKVAPADDPDLRDRTSI